MVLNIFFSVQLQAQAGIHPGGAHLPGLPGLPPHPSLAGAAVAAAAAGLPGLPPSSSAPPPGLLAGQYLKLELILS